MKILNLKDFWFSSSWVIFFSILVITGCIRPNYQTQYVNVPCHWRMEADEGSTLCNYRWWEQFQDPVLNQLIFTALVYNQDLRVAISRVFEFYDQLKVVEAALYPEVDGVLNYTRTQQSFAVPGLPAPGINRINNNFQAFLDLRWELDFWGRVRSASDAAYADLLAQVEARRALVVTIVSSVAEGYIRLRQLDAQLEVAKKTVESRQYSLRLAVDRYQLGDTSELEVKQAEAEVETAVISMLQLERAIPQQENLLSILIGQNPHTIQRGLAVDALQYPISIPAGLPSDLLIRRPDILEAEDVMIAANARVAEARALFFPQMELTGLYGSQSDKLHRFLTSPAEIWQYGVNAVQVIFDAGRIYYRVEETKAIRDQALYNYRQTILNAFREVEDALIETQMNQKLVKEHQIQVKVVSEYWHLAQLQYNEGEIDYLNVLDAERRLFNAQLSLVEAQADNMRAVVHLYRALGGGWVYDADCIAISNSTSCCN
jgi:multidrug efflux system outer membrane protein